MMRLFSKSSREIKATIRYILIALTIIAAIALLWNHDKDNSKSNKYSDMVPEAISYLTNTSQTTFNSTGKISSIIRSKKLELFPAPQPGHLTNPDITLFLENTSPWHIVSQEGLFILNKDKLTLKGQVTVSHKSKNGNHLIMKTPILHLNNKTHFIHTSSDVKITDHINKITSTGMNVWLDNKLIKLTSHVKGIYASSP